MPGGQELRIIVAVRILHFALRTGGFWLWLSFEHYAWHCIYPFLFCGGV